MENRRPSRGRIDKVAEAPSIRWPAGGSGTSPATTGAWRLYSGQRLIGLDLLRASAVLGVFVAHVVSFEYTHLRMEMPLTIGVCGLFAVELFFALSGFLIGLLLLDIAARSPTRNAWLRFMMRRWMRTLPLYLLWIVVLLVALPPATNRLSHVVTYLMLTQNLAWPMPPDNWFGVSWSLSVEEWFYLLSSAVILTLANRGWRNAVPIGCAAFILFSVLTRIFLVADNAEFDTGLRKIVLLRLDAGAYGVLVAWFLVMAPAACRRWRYWLILPAIGLLWLTIATLTDPVLLQALRAYVFTFVPLAFALLIPAVMPMRIAPAPLAQAVRWLSLRSYGLYIVHFSVIELAWREVARGWLPVWLATPVSVVVSVVLAELSWRFLESPVLRRRPKQFPDTPVDREPQIDVRLEAEPVPRVCAHDPAESLRQARTV